jgi:hypothetical protein
MISDGVVGDALLEALLGGGRGGGLACGGSAPAAGGAGEYAGVVVDGFPRTAVQVDFLKLLHDKLAALHRMHADGPLAAAFPRPSFKVVVLYVDEETSVRRQLQRAAQTQARNQRALDAGAGGLQAARATDVSADKARKRYTVRGRCGAVRCGAGGFLLCATDSALEKGWSGAFAAGACWLPAAAASRGLPCKARRQSTTGHGSGG